MDQLNFASPSALNVSAVEGGTPVASSRAAGGFVSSHSTAAAQSSLPGAGQSQGHSRA